MKDLVISEEEIVENLKLDHSSELSSPDLSIIQKYDVQKSFG
jgi:hypothetical protein